MEAKEKIINEWLRKANNDLQAAKILASQNHQLKDVISFHCQQSVEKFLKAYLIFNDVRPPKTHNLIELLNLIPDTNKLIDEFYNMANILEDMAVLVRYPMEHNLNIEEEINTSELILIAETFQKEVNENINNTKQ